MTEKTQLQFIWKQVKEKAQELISPVSFDAYIGDLEPVDIVGRKLLLKAPNDFTANAIMANKIGEKLRFAVEKCDLGIVNDFRIVVDGSDVYSQDTDEFNEDIFQSAPKQWGIFEHLFEFPLREAFPPLIFSSQQFIIITSEFLPTGKIPAVPWAGIGTVVTSENLSVQIFNFTIFQR